MFLLYSHVVQWGEVKRRWLRKRRRRKRHDLLASVVAEGKTGAEGGVGRREGGNRHCHRGYCWEGSVGAGEHRLQRGRRLNECLYFKLRIFSISLTSISMVIRNFLHKTGCFCFTAKYLLIDSEISKVIVYTVTKFDFALGCIFTGMRFRRVLMPESKLCLTRQVQGNKVIIFADRLWDWGWGFVFFFHLIWPGPATTRTILVGEYWWLVDFQTLSCFDHVFLKRLQGLVASLSLPVMTTFAEMNFVTL